MTASAPLYGLVLAGGESRRMGRDKALLDYHGRPQLEWAFQLVARHCERAFVSVRATQADGLRTALPRIVDGETGAGPIAGIAAAQAVTAYRSAYDGLPEPLCAIYEPETRPAILAAIASGRNCPRKFSLGSGASLLDLPDPAVLDNFNTPEELAAAAARLAVSTGADPSA